MRLTVDEWRISFLPCIHVKAILSSCTAHLQVIHSVPQFIQVFSRAIVHLCETQKRTPQQIALFARFTQTRTPCKASAAALQSNSNR